MRSLCNQARPVSVQDHGDPHTAGFYEVPHPFSPEKVELKKDNTQTCGIAEQTSSGVDEGHVRESQ
eukprot:10704615-Prorocentrum_lima.AAC.1